ncbi:MAG: NUDIX domain-containing protein [Pseudomonadota bacterium]
MALQPAPCVTQGGEPSRGGGILDSAVQNRSYTQNKGYICARMSRPSKISAGLLAFRRRNRLEVLLAHPGGPFWAKKDDGAWTIPKGLVESGADLFATAQREFGEETNLNATGEFVALAPVKLKGGKLLHAWAFEADFDLATFASNTFELEWPPRSGRRRSFPEIDRIAYFPFAAATTKILPYQRPLLRELVALIAQSAIGAGSHQQR